MCGIIGYIGDKKIANGILIDGLTSLEYRGYDSAGAATLQDGQIIITKTKGKVIRLAEKFKQHNIEESYLGIAHTRWATHGIPSEINSHPHQQGHVTLVHNGIIENYHELQEELLSLGYHFASDTDSEIATAYVDMCYQKHKDPLKAIQEAQQHFRGSYAFGIIFNDDIETLYTTRKNSPLILAFDGNGSYIASDIPAILKYTKQYILLEENDIAVLKKDNIHIYDCKLHKVEREPKVATMDITDIKKDGYEHFMMKEIHEEPHVVEATIQSFLKDDINDLLQSMPDLKKYKQLHIVACGSAMYAGMIAKSLIETKARIRVEVDVASEYRYRNPILDNDTLVIVVSQSGETADTLATLQYAKQQGVDTLAIVNVVGSSIAREAKYTLYTLAGPEISVATTKAYCTQVTLLSLIAINLAYVHGYLNQDEINEMLKQIKELPTLQQTFLQDTQYEQSAAYIAKHEHVFFLGRGLDYALSMEGSLKLKEISYIHSEAYAAGELKHGTISLIENGTPVIVLCTDETLYEKTMSNIKEVKARGAHIILFVREDFHITKDCFDEKIVLPNVDIFLQAMITVIPLQLLAYKIALLRGCEIDQPRNLAKSVTVE